MDVCEAAGVLRHHPPGPQDSQQQPSPQPLADMVQPHLVRTRAATQGQIRYGTNYRGELEMTRSSFKYRAHK